MGSIFWLTVWYLTVIVVIPCVVVLVLWCKNTGRVREIANGTKGWPATGWQRSEKPGEVKFAGMTNYGDAILVSRTGPFGRSPDPPRFEYTIEQADNRSQADGSLFWSVPRRLFYLLEREHESKRAIA